MFSRTLKPGKIVAPFVLLLSACAGPVPTLQPVVSLGGVAPPPARAHTKMAGYLYVAMGNQNEVVAYAPGKSKPAYTITDGINYPNSIQALAFDGSGKLYVANQGNGTITEYAPGATSPSMTLTQPAPESLLIDPTGRLYALSCQPCAPGSVHVKSKVYVYDPAKTKPAYSISKGLSYYSFSAALDSSNDLYVTSCSVYCLKVANPVVINGAVSQYASGQKTPTFVYTNGVNGPNSLAVDGTGTVYVGNAGDDTVSVYAQKRGTPLYTMWLGEGKNIYNLLLHAGYLYVNGGGQIYALSSGMLVNHVAIGGRQGVFDQHGNLYVVDLPNNEVVVYAAGSDVPARKIHSGMNLPISIAISP